MRAHELERRRQLVSSAGNQLQPEHQRWPCVAPRGQHCNGPMRGASTRQPLVSRQARQSIRYRSALCRRRTGHRRCLLARRRRMHTVDEAYELLDLQPRCRGSEQAHQPLAEQVYRDGGCERIHPGRAVAQCVAGHGADREIEFVPHRGRAVLGCEPPAVHHLQAPGAPCGSALARVRHPRPSQAGSPLDILTIWPTTSCSRRKRAKSLRRRRVAPGDQGVLAEQAGPLGEGPALLRGWRRSSRPCDGSLARCAR